MYPFAGYGLFYIITKPPTEKFIIIIYSTKIIMIKISYYVILLLLYCRQGYSRTESVSKQPLSEFFCVL